MTGPEEILTFWLDEVGPDGWYKQDDALDAKIRERFMPVFEEAMEGRFALWLTYPTGVLGYIILLDQFPRNMFRGEAQAFDSDPVALAAAKQAVRREWDLKIDPPARQFFYMPMMHSENLSDQEHCIRLVKDRMPNQGGDTLLHARAHREVIRQYGRFPYRNAALSRNSTASETSFMDKGGYGEILRGLQEMAA